MSLFNLKITLTVFKRSTGKATSNFCFHIGLQVLGITSVATTGPSGACIIAVLLQNRAGKVT